MHYPNGKTTLQGEIAVKYREMKIKQQRNNSQMPPPSYVLSARVLSCRAGSLVRTGRYPEMLGAWPWPRAGVRVLGLLATVLGMCPHPGQGPRLASPPGKCLRHEMLLPSQCRTERAEMFWRNSGT